YRIISSEYHPAFFDLQIEDEKNKIKFQLQTDLNGIYQQKNIVTTLAATDVLKTSFSFQNEKTFEGLKIVKKLTGLFGRWEIIHEKPTVALDVAHNEDGIRQLLLQIKKINYNSLHIIFGMVKDKDIQKVLQQFPKEAKYYFTKAHNPRALPEDQLKEMAANFSLDGETFTDVNKALKSAMDKASADDLIVVCGSVFLIAEVENF
ncbi:MAG: glutamate ligase domain-containing protein, partial [Ginsengibacter sp.]